MSEAQAHTLVVRSHWDHTSGAGLCYSPPQIINECLSIHHNSLATQDTDSSIILFLPKLAGTVSLCSSVWCVCIFPLLSICQLFFQDGFWLSPCGTGNQHALSPGPPTAEDSLGILPLKKVLYFKKLFLGFKHQPWRRACVPTAVTMGFSAGASPREDNHLLCQMCLPETIFT